MEEDFEWGKKIIYNSFSSLKLSLPLLQPEEIIL